MQRVENTAANAEQPAYAGWRPKSWRDGFSPAMPHSTFYGEVRLGLIDIVKVGTASLVTTSHSEYLRRRQAFNEARTA